jgi:hypothetical protein
LPYMPGHQYYFFDDTAGQDVPVYILDTGAQLDHPVSSAQLQSQ